MKYLLFTYNYKYIRSLLYLLQKNEYVISDFIRNLAKVKNFSNVEIRGKLSFTIKIKILFVINEFFWLFALSFPLFKILFREDYLYLFFLVILPITSLLFLVITSSLFTIFQKPFEYYLIYKAKNKLKNIRAVKIAIAGSYGKTSMREILFTILKEGKKVATVKENFNTPLGISNFIMSLNGDEEILIFEFGEYYKGDIKYLSNFIKPDIGIITGINEAHLDKFKNIKNTISTIFELSDYLNNRNIYVNTDNKYVKENTREGNIAFSVNGIESQKITNITSDLGGTKFEFMGQEYKSNLLGQHNISPITLAIHIAKKDFNLSEQEIKTGVSNIKPFKNRLELKSLGNNIQFLDDTYNGNIDGFRVTLDFLRNIKDRRIVYITPGLVETGDMKVNLHTSIGKKIVEVGVKNVVLVKNSATLFIEKGLRASNYSGQIIYFNSMLEILSKLETFTLPNDLVVIQNDWSDQYY